MPTGHRATIHLRPNPNRRVVTHPVLRIVPHGDTRIPTRSARLSRDLIHVDFVLARHLAAQQMRRVVAQMVASFDAWAESL